MPQHHSSTWVIVLAAGEGSRLAPLTRDLYGFDLPKQYAVLDGEQSLLQQTMARMSEIAPPERTMVVVASRYRELARQQLAPWRGVHLMSQPRNLGTGTGILWPLARVAARDPRARVAITPSDHHVPRPRPYLDAIRTAVRDGARRAAALLGVRAERPETEYGWIVPRGRAANQVHAVERFVEKPEAPIARSLHRRRALWNTFVLGGSVARMWKTAAARLPAHAAALHAHEHGEHAGDEAALASVFDRLPPSDFSRDVLSAATDLGVVPVEGSGWNDWGSPARVMSSLAEQGRLDSLLSRIRQRQLAAAPVQALTA